MYFSIQEKKYVLFHDEFMYFLENIKIQKGIEMPLTIHKFILNFIKIISN